MSGSGRERATWPLVDAVTMRALDQYTIEQLGVPADLLMESAGRVSAEVVLGVMSSHSPGAEVVVLCGAGSNGGDGLVVARHLAQAGVHVRVCVVGEPGRLQGEAAGNLERARALGIEVEGLPARLPGEGVIVDAILGTGLGRPLEGKLAEVVRQVNDARSERVSVVAIDVPTGLDATTGAVLGVAIESDVTVAISLPKLGLALEPGRSHAGRVRVARIGIADEAPEIQVAAELWSHLAVSRALPPRPGVGHKGSFGHVLLVAGSEGKTGAAALAAAGAVRMGAGLVTLACPEGLNAILEVKCTEAMTAPLPQGADCSLTLDALPGITELAGQRDALAIGPGLGRSDETQDLVRRLLSELDRPTVLDADGLFALGTELGALKARQAPTILTPHPGEAARLLGSSSSEVNASRVESARTLARESGCVVVLKGAPSVVADPSGRLVVNGTGGPALATGGTGDVLSGMIVALLGQGVAPVQAAASGVHLHGFAADRLTDASVPMGHAATDVADTIPAAVAGVLERAREDASDGVLGGGLALPFPGL